jgi:Tol biopolymer transport system component
MRFVALVLAVLSAITSLSCGDSARPRNGAIAVTYKDSVFVLQPDGSRMEKVPGTDRAGEAVWSPDGRRIAFSRRTATNSEIVEDLYVIRPDGSSLQLITRNGMFPSWSPDGKLLALLGDAPDDEAVANTSEIFVVGVDGRGRTRLTSNDGYDGEPDWSPDGKRLVFATDNGLFLMSSDGKERRRLTRGLRHSNPDWSPDGRMIVFDDGYFDIFVVEVESRDVRKLSRRRRPEFAPAWSPDGRYIIFLSTSANCQYCGADWPMQVWIMNTDGGQAHSITSASGFGAPSWGVG